MRVNEPALPTGYQPCSADLSLDSPMQRCVGLLPRREAVEKVVMDSKHHKLSVLWASCCIGPNAAITAVKVDHSKISECRRCCPEAARLAQARKRMEEIRINLVSKKIDSMAEREKALELGRVGKAKAVPFRERADQYITAHEGEGANHPSTGQQCATDVRRGKACSSATIRSGG